MKTDASSQKVPRKLIRRSGHSLFQMTFLIPIFVYQRLQCFAYKNTHVFSPPDVRLKTRQLNLEWMMSHALEIEVFPMWVGFSSRFHRHISQTGNSLHAKPESANHQFGSCSSYTRDITKKMCRRMRSRIWCDI